jgi:hypothetical protein
MVMQPCRGLKLEPFSLARGTYLAETKGGSMEKKREFEIRDAGSVAAALRDELTILSIITIGLIVALWVAATL